MPWPRRDDGGLMERKDAGRGSGKRMLQAATTVIVLGCVIGVVSGLLAVLLKGVQWLMMGYSESSSMPGPYQVAWQRRLIAVVVGAFVAGVLWWLLRTRVRRVPSVAKAVDGERMPVLQTVVHVLLQIFIVGCGSSVGREVAPREAAAMISQRFCDLLHIDSRDRRTVVAIAAAAGLAGVYNAPLAGTFFAVEILLTDVSVETVTLALAMNVVAAYVASFIKGRGVFYDMHLLAGTAPSVALTLFAVVCGLLSGLLGYAFRRASKWAQGRQTGNWHLLFAMPLAALATGIVAIWLPQVMGNGRTAAQFAFSLSGATVRANVSHVVLVLLAILIGKASLTVLTIRSGASGGVLQPGISLGAVWGALLGCVPAVLLPGLYGSVSPTACALVGAASLLSASQQAPLMAMALVMELTNAPVAFAVPIAMGAAAAMVSSRCAETLLSHWA